MIFTLYESRDPSLSAQSLKTCAEKWKDNLDASVMVGDEMNHVFPLFPIPEATLAGRAVFDAHGDSPGSQSLPVFSDRVIIDLLTDLLPYPPQYKECDQCHYRI